MSVKERPVYTSANLAMFMVNLSHALIRPMREEWPAFSVNDLKAWFRGRKYATELLKWLPESPGSIFIDQVVAHMAGLGRLTMLPTPLNWRRYCSNNKILNFKVVTKSSVVVSHHS
jgi:hypothetical protein